MNYQETVELEKNIKIKNKAQEIVKGFKKNVVLNLCEKDGLRFKIWSDSHNAVYVDINEKYIICVCEFLHESYSVPINESSVFTGIVENYRGINHVAGYAKVSYNEHDYK